MNKDKMKFKTSLLVAASALVVLASCSNDTSTPEQNEITFKSVNQKSTKAGFYGPMNDATYNVAEHFGVYAFLNTGTALVPNWSSNNFMTNVEIEATGVSPYTWKNATTSYFWPNVGSLNFACYSPYGFKQNGTTDANIVSASYDKGIAFKDFIAPTTNDKQIDLMVADLIESKTSQSTAVQVVFKHVLSQIKFTASTKADFSSDNDNVDKIVINSIKVHSLKTKGSYASTDGSYTNGNWTVSPDAIGLYEIPSTTLEINTNTNTLGNSLIVLPQNAKGYSWTPEEGADPKNIFEINYTITFKDGSITNEIPNTVYYQPTTEWVKGYIYTYNLQIGLNEITFAPEVVEKWESGESNNLEL